MRNERIVQVQVSDSRRDLEILRDIIGGRRKYKNGTVCWRRAFTNVIIEEMRSRRAKRIK